MLMLDHFQIDSKHSHPAELMLSRLIELERLDVKKLGTVDEMSVEMNLLTEWSALCVQVKGSHHLTRHTSCWKSLICMII